MKTLKDVKRGQSAVVLKINCEKALKRRLLDMGLTKGITVAVRKIAPLGDPIEISLRGYALGIRRSDAGGIVVD